VAFSGGVDSTFLLALALETLGTRNVLALTSVGTFSSQAERERSRRLARQLGAEHRNVDCDELSHPEISANNPHRCYHCKHALLGRLQQEARQHGFETLASGTHAGDTGDYRPGLRAEEELGIFRPLMQAGLDKQQVRCLSQQMGLETWDLPSAACLASRIPYGEQITEEKLRQVEQAESLLVELGFGQLRVRHHAALARIEVPSDDFERVLKNRDRICSELGNLGFAYVTLDLKGFRSGAMNEVLPGRGEGK
jgi:uncharacterized protein